MLDISAKTTYNKKIHRMETSKDELNDMLHTVYSQCKTVLLLPKYLFYMLI